MTDKKSPNIRINKVYTRTGDSGKTRLIGGKERWKDDSKVEAYGTVDELNSAIGICRELIKETGNENFCSLVQLLKSVQNELFNLGRQLAESEGGEYKNLPQLSDDAILKTSIRSARNVADSISKGVLRNSISCRSQ